MRPAFYPERTANKVESHKNSPSITQLWHRNGRCPENTIPVRRTKRDDLLRASSVKRYGRKKHKSIPMPLTVDSDLLNESGHQHAIAYVEGDRYYGAKATINVWRPKIQQTNEFSLSQLWILGGSFGEDLNSIEAGWQSDAYQATGCYNLLCAGFIQISNEIAMGASIFPLSDYGGSQYDISILVWKVQTKLMHLMISAACFSPFSPHACYKQDPQEGHWWIQFGNDYVLGYWPSFLFSYLTESASMIQWGGEVVNSELEGEHTSTGMGSGHFPEEGFGKASYFRNIQIVDGSNNLRAPKEVGTFTEQSSCYDVQNGNNDDWGHYIYYGGPGRNTGCP
ncbi:hypothetical protein C4D60_Mb07t21290 [Musa balbisiana]|uniref:Neprosin PEP catalytic domain-containing protein n=1 Tax=Musa balbisiana TaxID=52838 RepID=A0A4S8JGX9_MUSBA|nr:hypothetical protein C4D60_Mb07t21290 [Musa balbisiana]